MKNDNAKFARAHSLNSDRRMPVSSAHWPPPQGWPARVVTLGLKNAFDKKYKFTQKCDFQWIKFRIKRSLFYYYPQLRQGIFTNNEIKITCTSCISNHALAMRPGP